MDINKDFPGLSKGMEDAEMLRKEYLKKLGDALNRRAKLLADEKDRLIKKYKADHPRVLKIEAKLKFEAEILPVIKDEAARKTVDLAGDAGKM